MPDATMIQCPHCGQAYFVQPHQWAQYQGQTISCTRCGKAFNVIAPQLMPPQMPPNLATNPPGIYAPAAPTVFSPAAPGLHPAYAGAMYPPAPTQTSGWAVASLILGILSFCLPTLGSLAAIATSIPGLVQTRQRRMGGRGLAVVGLATGLFTLVIVSPLLFLVMLPAANKGREIARRVQCADNMKDLGIALMSHAETHGNAFPGQLDDLAELSPPPRVSAFVCPSDNKTPPAAAPPESMAADINTGQHCSYVYVGAGVRATNDPKIVILYEPLGNHSREGMNVLFADGHSQWLNADEAQTILEQRLKGKRPIRLDPTRP